MALNADKGEFVLGWVTYAMSNVAEHLPGELGGIAIVRDCGSCNVNTCQFN